MTSGRAPSYPQLPENRPQSRKVILHCPLRELHRLDLFEGAVAVARAYGRAHDLHEVEIAAALEPIIAGDSKSRDSKSVAATIRRLERIGFIWQPGCAGPDCYSRGIPSLMDYVLKAASPATSATSV